MDSSRACTDLCQKSKDSCLRSSEELDSNIVSKGKVNEDVPKLSETTDSICIASLEPITPYPVREIGDLPISPLTVVRKVLKLSSDDSSCDEDDSKLAFVDKDSPQTPMDGVFDPFAPGPENAVRAPLCNKYIDNGLSSNVARRRLDFDLWSNGFKHDNPSYDAESLSDEEMIESVYENLLEVIVSKQADGIEYDSGDYKSPPPELRFSGIADTCPGAPVKPKNETKNGMKMTDMKLCRKLEF